MNTFPPTRSSSLSKTSINHGRQRVKTGKTNGFESKPTQLPSQNSTCQAFKSGETNSSKRNYGPREAEVKRPPTMTNSSDESTPFSQTFELFRSHENVGINTTTADIAVVTNSPYQCVIEDIPFRTREVAMRASDKLSKSSPSNSTRSKYSNTDASYASSETSWPSPHEYKETMSPGSCNGIQNTEYVPFLYCQEQNITPITPKLEHEIKHVQFNTGSLPKDDIESTKTPKSMISRPSALNESPILARSRHERAKEPPAHFEEVPSDAVLPLLESQYNRPQYRKRRRKTCERCRRRNTQCHYESSSKTCKNCAEDGKECIREVSIPGARY